MSHQLNKDLDSVLNQWANHQGGDDLPGIGDSILNNAAVRLLIAHQVIHDHGVAHLAASTMEGFMTQYDLQTFIAWRVIRECKKGMGLVGDPYTTHGMLVSSNLLPEKPFQCFIDEESITPSRRPYHTGNSPVPIHKDIICKVYDDETGSKHASSILSDFGSALYVPSELVVITWDVLRNRLPATDAEEFTQRN